MSQEEKEYIEYFWGTQSNYYEFLAKLPDGVHPVPIHSLGMLHLSCDNKETLAATLACSPHLWSHMQKGFRLISMGTRHYSTKPSHIPTLLALKEQIDPTNPPNT